MVYHIAGGSPTIERKFSVWFEPLDGDEDRIELHDMSPDGGSLITRRGYSAGRRVKLQNVPTKLLRDGAGPEVEPLIDVERWVGQELFVNDTFKDILEELEPDVHQFFPMDLYVKNRNPADFEPEDNTYIEPKGTVHKHVKVGHGYWLNICNRLDTLHKELCPGLNELGFYIVEDGEPLGGKVFSTDAIGGHHIWHEKFTQGTLISDIFAERLQDAGVTGIFFKKYKQA